MFDTKESFKKMWWRKAHENFSKLCFEEFGLIFTEECQLVLEEFEVVYPLREE